MADFCRQCGIAEFGMDTRDLAGLTKPEDWAKGLAVGVICEGCGIIQVDPEGNCITPECSCRHGAADENVEGNMKEEEK
jgi:hypothetical protein